MNSTVTSRSQSQEVPNLDSVRPRMAKADGAVTVSHTPLRRVIEQAVRALGKLDATAGDMRIDRAQMYRQFENGHLTVEHLERLDVNFYVELGKQLLEHYGPLATPYARAKQKVREAREALNEIDQALELIA